jgi:hypothetical protein
LHSTSVASTESKHNSHAADKIRYPEAEAAARRALDANPCDAWAVHALIHVFEMTGRSSDGERYLRESVHLWRVRPVMGLLLAPP